MEAVNINTDHCNWVNNMLEYSFFAEKLRWESINVDGADDQMPKPRAGHSAVNVNRFSVLLSYQCGRLHLDIVGIWIVI